MSQAKVDRYKESKKHRKEEVKKAKRNKVLARVIGCVVAVVIVFWIAFSGYHVYQSNKPIEHTAVNFSATSDYISGLTAQE